MSIVSLGQDTVVDFPVAELERGRVRYTRSILYQLHLLTFF